METRPEDSDFWQQPPGGYLKDIQEETLASRRRRSLRRDSLILVLVLLIAGVGVYGISRVARPGSVTLPGIPCSIVQENQVAYLAGTLDADLQSQIQAHLERCARCRAMLAEMPSAKSIHDVDSLKIAAGQLNLATWLKSSPTLAFESRISCR